MHFSLEKEHKIKLKKILLSFVRFLTKTLEFIKLVKEAFGLF